MVNSIDNIYSKNWENKPKFTSKINKVTLDNGVTYSWVPMPLYDDITPSDVLSAAVQNGSIGIKDLLEMKQKLGL
jgi:hypothetical protein